MKTSKANFPKIVGPTINKPVKQADTIKVSKPTVPPVPVIKVKTKK